MWICQHIAKTNTKRANRILPKGEFSKEGRNLSKPNDEKIAHSEKYALDRINILKASLLAMLKSIEGLGLSPTNNIVLVDGNQLIPHLSFQQETTIKGDANSISIAVASVFAKESRDHYLKDMDSRYPGYGFAKHVSYGT